MVFEFSQHGPLPTGLAGQFLGALALSHYFWVVGSAPNCRWRAIVSEPIRTARVDVAWAGNREYHLFSRFHESERSTTGGDSNSPVVDCFLSESPTVPRNICAAGVITNCRARCLRRIHL